MTEPPRQRRQAVLSREAWRRRIGAAWEARSNTYRNRRLVWRLLGPAVFVLAGTLFVTSSVSSDGTDLRAGRYGDLSTVVSQATEDADELRAERAALAREVEELTADLNEAGVSDLQERVDELEMSSGLTAMRGPGLTVELDDAPAEVIAQSDDPSLLVVHQQDIQAVVDAMWIGGAEAMTVQGQRVISTTGIKCVGNTVVLHGIPYSPPYVITAVGDPASMLTALNESTYVDTYRDYVARYDLGWDVLPHDDLELPAYDGLLDLDHARAAGGGDSSSREDGGV